MLYTKVERQVRVMNWLLILGIFLFVFGFLFIAIEVLLPGFGAPGVAGIICIVAGVALTADTVIQAVYIISAVFVLLFILIVVMMTLISKGKIKTQIILDDRLDKESGYISSTDMQYLVGKTGIAETDLRPSGKVSIEGVEFDAISDGRYIDKGASVIILKISNSSLVAKAV